MTIQGFADRCLPGGAIDLAAHLELHDKRRWIAGQILASHK